MADRSTLRFVSAPLHGGLNLAWQTLASYALPRATAKATDFNQIIQTLDGGDEVQASAMYAGVFNFTGQTFSCSPADVFLRSDASSAWQAQLHDLHWLKHFAASGRSLHAHFALRLLGYWAKSRYMPRDTETLSRIVTSLATYGPILAKSCDNYLQSEFLSLMSSAFTKLHRKTARNPETAVHKAIAELYAITAFRGFERHRLNAMDTLQQAIDKIILPDGGHFSRQPAKLVALLAALLPLKSAMRADKQHFSISTIDRMIPMLRLLTHSDGSLAHTECSQQFSELMKCIHHSDDLKAKPHPLASYSGFAKLEGRKACMIANTKSNFAIEFSDGPQLLFRNTVAASTATTNAELRQSNQGSLLQINEKGGQQRSCFLSADGSDLRIEDVHMGSTELCFELHSDIKLLNLREGKGFMLISPDRIAWNLTFRGAEFHTEQNGALIIVTNLDHRCINWALKKQVKTAKSAARSKTPSTDLLDL